MVVIPEIDYEPIVAQYAAILWLAVAMTWALLLWGRRSGD